MTTRRRIRIAAEVNDGYPVILGAFCAETTTEEENRQFIREEFAYEDEDFEENGFDFTNMSVDLPNL